MSFSQLSGPSRDTPSFDKFFHPSLSCEGLIRPTPPSDGVLFDAPGYTGGLASGLKVFAIANDMFACGNLRVRYPLMTLAAKGARVKICILTDTTPIHLQDMYWANVLLVQRWGTPEVLDAITALSKSTGAAVVYELDDYLHGVHPDSPAYPLYNPKTSEGALQLQTINRWTTHSDGVIFSTRELASMYSNSTMNSHVILNGLDLTLGERDWNTPKQDWRVFAKDCHVTDNSLLFGVSFSNTHIPDMAEMGDSVAEVLSRTKDTFFGMQTDPEMAYDYVKKHNLPLERVVYIPPTDFLNYPPSLSLFDVALCPLQNTTFNYCKSDLRILEFGAQGVPYVASKVAPFQRFHLQSKGQGGLIADNPNQWAGQIIKLLKSTHYRQAKSEFIRHYVRDQYNISDGAEDLTHTLHSFILARKGRIRAESLQSTRDRVRGIPQTIIPIVPKEKCPCGSGKSYLQCCTPAWG